MRISVLKVGSAKTCSLEYDSLCFQALEGQLSWSARGHCCICCISKQDRCGSDSYVQYNCDGAPLDVPEVPARYVEALLGLLLLVLVLEVVAVFLVRIYRKTRFLQKPP